MTECKSSVSSVGTRRGPIVDRRGATNDESGFRRHPSSSLVMNTTSPPRIEYRNAPPLDLQLVSHYRDVKPSCEAQDSSVQLVRRFRRSRSN
ncbi:hypothetical protein MPTK1_1g05210 [Marchantia polymorpha subsp. ruderalis]|uniref:Uncharacterized protein n=2 Tax=Marchantia polymorpha TaxID=3197 RepID=A0AAF6ALP5_MARPO|nr:hypothetical protein MARPO_0005s0087 [Marchantia polymorpha]BBM97365.1 hypothetical protein Mp_1g05210 [Marchantia polymorpha subsp. ruderalis]|eukprot:PTQ48441.1 hypothetical protein MARPO_0005s0087 [Marchantia polymorpha]